MSAQENQIANRSDDAFDANQRLADAAAALHFVSRVPMFCECPNPTCDALVLIGLDRYHEIRQDPTLSISAPGHRIRGYTVVDQEPGFWLQRRGKS